MKKLTLVVMLGLTMSMVFYCGTAYRVNSDAQAEDAGIDAGTCSDAGVCPDAGTVCDCPEPPTTCQDCIQTDVVDVVTTVDGSAVVHLPGFDTTGVTIQVWSRVFSPDASNWQLAGPECQPVVFTEPPHYAPNLQVPALYYSPGLLRHCRVVLTWKSLNE